MRRLAVVLLAAFGLAACGGSTPRQTVVYKTGQFGPGVVTDHSRAGAVLADERYMIVMTVPYQSWAPGYRIVNATPDGVRFENLYLFVGQGEQNWATVDVMVRWQQGRWVAQGRNLVSQLGAAFVNAALPRYARWGG